RGKDEREAKARALLAKVGIGQKADEYPSRLSGGQQQRVAIARALFTRPEVVFGDEPTGNLDSRTGAEVLSLMRTSTREMGQTIIMVTHDPVAASYADNVLLMKD
ncbi:ABC transporter, partial [Escherichia coli]|uniref:ABC transporter ATP-binding protein n=1 Tax=Escherichia coli TaxID=562 RepID=UPI0022AF4B1D